MSSSAISRPPSIKLISRISTTNDNTNKNFGKITIRPKTLPFLSTRCFSIKDSVKGGEELDRTFNDSQSLPKPLTSSNLGRSGYRFRVAYQGLPGAYSEAAAEKAYRNCEKVPCEQFETAFDVGALLDTVKWDDKGLAVAIAQNIDTGAILMQGFANREALATTISSRKATFYSRSRSSLWTKGETSTNFINIHDIFLDCDRDSIIYLGKPDGPTCHTGAETCYYSSVFGLLEEPQARKECLASTTLYSLEDTICQREEEIETTMNGKPSWTKRLLLDKELLSSKVREEAWELVQTLLENEDRSRTASEMADLLYHSMVLLRVKGVKVEEVLEVLRKRFSQSGVEEKTSRNKFSNQS